MPSDTAFLEILGDPDYTAFVFDSAVMSMKRYDSNPINLGIEGISIRSVYQPIMALQGIGIQVDLDSPIFKALRTIIITNYSILMLQGAYRSIVKAALARETAYAAAETAVWACVPVIGGARIALAAGAALLVTATLSGWYVGEKIGSGDWTLPMGDINNPQERRQMENALANTGVRRRG